MVMDQVYRVFAHLLSDRVDKFLAGDSAVSHPHVALIDLVEAAQVDGARELDLAGLAEGREPLAPVDLQSQRM